MFDLRMINMSSECEYDWYWKISACSTEYEVCDSFASLTHHQTSYSGSTGWYFRFQSIHIQITYTYHQSWPNKMWMEMFILIVLFQLLTKHLCHFFMMHCIFSNCFFSLTLEPLWSWSYGIWSYKHLCNQCLSPLNLWVRIQLMARCTRWNFMW